MPIPKPNKPRCDSSSYSPIYLSKGVGKIFERATCNRLRPVIEKKGGLLDRQFIFRRTRSIVNLISMAAKITVAVIKTNKFFAVVTLDVRNAKYLVRIVIEFLLESLL